MHHVPVGTGWIEVVCGSMFSGKTEELISRIRREIYARRKVQVFKPRTDDRYAEAAIVSHIGDRIECTPVHRARDLLELIDDDTVVVGIDEVQFFGEAILAVADELANRGLRVICAGLDQDYQGQPFEPMPQLLAIAEFITKKHAVCMKCGNPANRSQRMTASESRVVIGAAECYEARCRRCHSPVPMAAPDQKTLPIPGLDHGPLSAPGQPSLPLLTVQESP